MREGAGETGREVMPLDPTGLAGPVKDCGFSLEQGEISKS